MHLSRQDIDASEHHGPTLRGGERCSLLELVNRRHLLAICCQAGLSEMSFMMRDVFERSRRITISETCSLGSGASERCQSCEKLVAVWPFCRTC